MSFGKAAAQAGHAWTDHLLDHSDDPWNRAYRQLRPGTKIMLDGGSERGLLRLADSLSACGYPTTLIRDRDHVEPPDFDGSEILTALGVGPFPRGSEPACLRRLPLWRGGRCAMG